MISEKYQCPMCFENDCDVSITEHRDMYATGDSPSELEITSTCCGADVVEVDTYCQCGNEVYDDGMCLDCYKKAGTLADERYDKKYIIERAVALSNLVEDAGGHLFFEYSPHVNWVGLDFYSNGWGKNIDADSSINIYLCGLNGCPREIYDEFESLVKKEIGSE